VKAGQHSLVLSSRRLSHPSKQNIKKIIDTISNNSNGKTKFT